MSMGMQDPSLQANSSSGSHWGGGGGAEKYVNWTTQMLLCFPKKGDKLFNFSAADSPTTCGRAS